MKARSATIEIRPRSVVEIVDLACLFYRTHMGICVGLLLVLGLPLLAIAVGLLKLTGQAWPALGFLWLTSTIPSGAILLAASRLVFGTQLNTRRTLSLYRSLWGGLFLRQLGQRLLQLLLLPVVAGYILRLKWAFTPMIVMLERLGGHPMALRRKGLYRRSGGSSFGLDVFLTLLVQPLCVAGISLLLDLVLTDFLSIWTETGLFTWEVFDEPLKLGVWGLAWLFTLPLCAFSWFFLYLNTRIRGEGWDLELGFKSTASRISPDREVA